MIDLQLVILSLWSFPQCFLSVASRRRNNRDCALELSAGALSCLGLDAIVTWGTLLRECDWDASLPSLLRDPTDDGIPLLLVRKPFLYNLSTLSPPSIP